ALHGRADAPLVTGRVDSPAATLRGVTVLNTGAAITYQAGSLALDDGSAQLGSSQLAVSGHYGAGSAALQARSSHVDASDFNDFFEGRDVFDGVGSVSLALALAPRSTDARGYAALSDASIAGIPVGDVQATLANAGSDGVHLDLTQRSQLGESTLSGDLAFVGHDAVLPDFRNATFRAAATTTGVDLGLVARLAGLEDVGLRGVLDAHGTAHGTLRKPLADIAFTVRNGYVRKLQLRDAHGRIVSDGSGVQLADAVVVMPFGQATANARLRNTGALSGAAQLSVTDLHGMAELAAPHLDISGAAHADVRLHGNVHHPVFEANIAGQPGEISGVAYDQLAARASFAKNELTIGDTSLRLAHGRGTLTLSGTLPLEFQPFGLGPARRPVALHVTASKIDVSAFDPLLKDFGTVTGTVDANASVTGTAGQPQLAGSAMLSGGGVRSKYQSVPLHNINGDLVFSQDSITLTDLSGVAGKGSFAGKGKAYVVPAVGLRKTPGIAYYANVHATDFPLDVPDWVSGRLNGDIGLTQSGATPLLAGNAQLNDGAVPVSAIVQLATTLGDTGPPPAANVPGAPPLRPGHIIAYGGGVYPPGDHIITTAAIATPAPTFFDLPSLNLQLTTQASNVRVRGGPIDLTTDGSLDIGGSVRDPQLTGGFSAKRGTIAAYGVAFHVERGLLSFDPDQGVLPSLDATASTLIDGDRVTLDVSGRVDHLNTIVSSSSGQTPEQILATILTGSTAGALVGGVTQQTLGESAQRLLGAELTRSLLAPFSNTLAQSLDVEQVSFEFNAQGQIVFEVRKYVSPTVAVLYGSTITQPVVQYWGGSYRVRNGIAVELTTTTSPSGQTLYSLVVRAV
ncbi:MAG: translocation/assembly module TamB domain-containing protein, partial [Candidatus Eremiobacteraeota bacterium]|nr:translocation/assembly module TamB domain-containing protein [Candidatus Eremiobacteraeota bacterium]